MSAQDDSIRGLSPLAGIPIIRKGDNVYFLNGFNFSIEREQQMLQQYELLSLRWENYSCPFSILNEFEQWWQWHYRVTALKESTGTVMCDMLSDVARIKKHKIERKIEIKVSQAFCDSLMPNIKNDSFGFLRTV